MPPAEELRCDVAVVGGGPAGLAASVRLGAAGADVVLLEEAAELGGQYYKPRLGAVLARYGDYRPAGGRLIAAARNAGVRCLTGHLVWGVDGRTLLALDVRSGTTRPVQASACVVATGAYERAIPFPGWQLPGVVTPGHALHLATLVTGAYLDAAVRHGATVRAFSPVTCVDRQRAGYLVTAGQQKWSAPVLVNVAGPWISPVAALCGIEITMNPVAIQMHVTVRIPLVMDCLVQHIGHGLSVKQVAAGQILIGGGWPAAGLDLDGRSPASVASLRGNLALATRILPFISRLRLLRMWAGPLAATPDEMPVIGQVPGWPGYFLAGGTYAFTLAPLWARCLAALIEGRDPPVSLAGLGPGRLMPDLTERRRS